MSILNIIKSSSSVRFELFFNIFSHSPKSIEDILGLSLSFCSLKGDI